MLNIRELPPLRLHALVTAPNGNTFRWGQDERRPENCFSGLTFSTVMPGGFEAADCTLPRKVGVSYRDLVMLSTLQIKGASGRIAGEFRLEKTPRVSDLTERTISPQLVGWQAHLDDSPEVVEVYVDRDLTHWIPASRARKELLYSFTFKVIGDPSVDPDNTTSIPALNLTVSGTGSAILAQSEAWYDCGPGAGVGSIYYDMTSQETVAGDTGIIGSASDDVATLASSSADLLTGSNSSATNTFTPSPTTYRFATAAYTTSASAEFDHKMMWRRLTVWGNSGIPKQGTAPADGVFASDVIANAVSRWAPKLQFTTGADGTVKPTSFIIPQLEFRQPTTVSDVLTQANRFTLGDWAVWENPYGRSIAPTFYYNDRGARGRKWRARVAPCKLTETGQQVDRLWNGVIVTYQDVDGTTKSVGPPGTRVDVTDASLFDSDPLNPITQFGGMKRYGRLDMGITSTSAAAIKVGSIFLERAKDLDHSGSAELVGHVEDDKGVMHPAWAVRAGDQIAFVDAADTSYRTIVHTSYSHDSRTCSIDLDSPPEGMDSLLERLGASLSVGAASPPLTDASAMVELNR